MRKSRTRDAHAVILPAFDSTTLSDSVKRFLAGGGCSILLGESRKEYVARKVSDNRKSTETADTFLHVTRKAAELAGDLLVVVDQEICGICRLHDLIPPFPEIDKLEGINIALDPATDPGAIVTEKEDSFKPGFIPLVSVLRCLAVASTSRLMYQFRKRGPLKWKNMINIFRHLSNYILV